MEDLGANASFEATTLLGGADEMLLIELEFGAGLGGVPGENG